MQTSDEVRPEFDQYAPPMPSWWMIRSGIGSLKTGEANSERGSPSLENNSWLGATKAP